MRLGVRLAGVFQEAVPQTSSEGRQNLNLSESLFPKDARLPHGTQLHKNAVSARSQRN